MFKCYYITHYIPLIQNIPDDLKDLIRGMLVVNSCDRLTFRKIYEHPWLRQVDNVQYEASDVPSEWSSVILQESIRDNTE